MDLRVQSVCKSRWLYTQHQRLRY